MGDRHVPSQQELQARSQAQRDYPAEMRDVPFPYAAADAAIQTCRRIAKLLDDHLKDRPDLVAQACDGWRGGHRDDYVETWDKKQQPGLSALKGELQALVGDIEDAWDEALRINRSRATMRANHDTEEAAPTR